MRKEGIQPNVSYVYFVGETDVFRYESTPDFADLVRNEHPDLARRHSEITEPEIGLLLGESLDNDALELRLKTQPERRVYAWMVLLSETFLSGSESFRTLGQTRHNSILYSVFRLAEGGYLIRSCGSFSGTGLLPPEEAIAKLCDFISIPFLRSRFDSDRLSPSSAYHLIAKGLDKPSG